MEGEKIERNCVCKEGKGEKLYMEGEKNESGNCMESIKKKREKLCMESEKKREIVYGGREKEKMYKVGEKKCGKLCLGGERKEKLHEER